MNLLQWRLLNMAGTQIRDSGSNYKFFDKKIKSNISRSVFDLSYLNTFSADFGQLIPCYVEHTLPNEDYEIRIESIIRCINPPLVPLLSRMRAFFHYYWIDYNSLWRGFQSFITKGRNNDFITTVPSVKVTQDAIDQGLFGRGTLSDYLGFNVVDYSALANGHITVFNALSMVMYQKIYRAFYMNQNLYYEGNLRKMWFPRYDGDFRLKTENPYVDIAAKDTPSDEYNIEDIGLGVLRYRNFVEDYFTSALPWPQRGDAPELTSEGVANIDGIPVGVLTDQGWQVLNLTAASDGMGVSTLANNNGGTFNPIDRLTSVPAGSFIGSLNAGMLDNQLGGLVKKFNLTAKGTAAVSLSQGITLAALRELNSAQRILEKMAHIDGSYGEFCLTFFGNKPKSAEEHDPIYIGGAYQAIQMSDVLQSGGTVGSQIGGQDAVTIQGTQSGYAFSHDDGYIGKFHSDDYGIIMGIISIMPDLMYSQGIRRQDSMQVQEEFYLPERAGLGPQAILNRELFYDPSAGDDQNNGLFAYISRYDQYRYRSNEIHGLVADDTNLSFFPYTQSRKFNTLPKYSQEFMTTKGNVRKDFLTAPDEVPFIVQVANNVRAVRPLPYYAVPAELFNTN
ncbi:putative VP1 [Microviridae sp.]|nr:putative VP1 [Microviridae sp.]WDY38258.1 major capsid protein [Rattus norvegicus microvirus]